MVVLEQNEIVEFCNLANSLSETFVHSFVRGIPCGDLVFTEVVDPQLVPEAMVREPEHPVTHDVVIPRVRVGIYVEHVNGIAEQVTERICFTGMNGCPIGFGCGGRDPDRALTERPGDGVHRSRQAAGAPLRLEAPLGLNERDGATIGSEDDSDAFFHHPYRSIRAPRRFRGILFAVSMPRPPRLPLSERLRRVGIAAWAIIGVLVLLYLALRALLYIRVIFAPLGLAILIILLLNPLITRLEQRRVPRSIATLLAYVVVLGSFTLILVITIPYVAEQVDQFSDQWPEFRDKTVSFVDDAAAEIEDRFGINVDTTAVDCLLPESERTPTERECDEATRAVRETITDRLGSFTEIGRSLLEILLVFVLAPLIALYVLIDLPQIKRDVLALIPESHRDEAIDLGAKIYRAFSGFLRGQVFVAFIVFVLSALGFLLIGLPFWLLIGAIAGFFNLVPLIGPFIGGALGFLVGTLTSGVELGLKAAVVELIVQQLDNHIISPNVMKRTVQLHPATVMLALLAGGALAGFWGVLLGVPAVAVAKLLLGHLWATRVLGVEPSPFAHTRLAGAPPDVVPPEDESG